MSLISIKFIKINYLIKFINAINYYLVTFLNVIKKILYLHLKMSIALLTWAYPTFVKNVTKIKNVTKK